jgi:large repetitive protein
MKRTLRVLSSSLVLLASTAANARDLPSYDASFSAPAASGGPRAAAANAAAERITSTDPRTGAPSFVWGPAGAAAPLLTSATPLSPERSARAHLAAHAGLHGLSKAALDAARVEQIHDTGRGGVLVVLRQHIGGVPLYQHDAKVLLRRDGSLVALSGGLHPLAVDAPKAAAPFSLPAAGAVARALSDLYSMTVPASALAPNKAATRGEWAGFDLKSAQQGGLSAVRFDVPARARKVYFVLPEGLVPAYYLEISAREDGGEDDMYGYVVSAADGHILKRKNLTAHAEVKYRVWADGPDGRPMDGPIADFTPHPTGVPDGSFPSYVAPPLVTMDGFNKFQDPWLPADATVSRGNNVDAYTDHDNSNNVNGGDVRATFTAPGELDRVYDTALGPLASEDQEMAAVTQLFYTINWLHDYWYDSGFDEAAGNAQQDNYGRGGQDNDWLRAEAQDAFNDGASNNANMATPEDGLSPRMQMYVWDGKDLRSLLVGGSPDSLQTGAATFCPPSFDLTGAVVLANDGVSPTANACEDIVNDVAGKIALVDRGSCTFHEKAINAQAAGAIGMILANNQAGAPPDMPGGNFPDVSIPVLSITQADGAALKTAIAAGTVTVTMKREGGVQADGTIDNLVVAHEWGHYLHHRLVLCGLNQCGAESEGWGDFLALTTSVREGDDLDGTFADSVYASQAFTDAAYFGIRRMPYTVDMTKNPLTFRHIVQGEELPMGQPLNLAYPDNAEVHNAGEVWCSMMFEGYVSILKQSKAATPKYSFDEARRRMADYVVAGMKLAPVEPTFTEQRDAIIAAAYALDPEDAVLIAQGFAKRGAGSCAVSPPRESFTNEGVVESFDVAPAVSITEVVIDDSVISCDKDGVVDANETGKVTVKLANNGFIAAPDTKIKVVSGMAGVTFPSGAEATIPMLEGFATTEVTFEVQIDPKQKASSFLDLTVTAENAAACNPNVVSKQAPRVHYDNTASSSATDDFESDIDVWSTTGGLADEVWSKDEEETGNRLWHGVDYSSISDTALVTPALTVSDAESLVISFRHRHKFETSDGELWDGSVIEITTDGGATWGDISQYTNPGYGGVIGNQAENPLSDRMGYTDTNAAWPGYDTVSLDLGTALAGKTVQLRFRIGTDQAASDEGWWIDDVAFQGIAGKPFPTVVSDAQSCSPKVDGAPVADAGPDQTVNSGVEVELDASASADPDGDALSFAWSQVGGPAVALSADGGTATFDAPSVTADTELLFAVKVTANGLSNEDTVRVLVRPEGSDLEISGGACGCSVPGEDGVPRAPLGALGAGLLGLAAIVRRRRAR